VDGDCWGSYHIVGLGYVKTSDSDTLQLHAYWNHSPNALDVRRLRCAVVYPDLSGINLFAVRRVSTGLWNIQRLTIIKSGYNTTRFRTSVTGISILNTRFTWLWWFIVTLRDERSCGLTGDH
jgi:hypothetical protein